MQFLMNSVLVAIAAIAVLLGTAGVAQADLIAHWAFDETSGTTADDSTGNHDGTIDTTSGYGPTIGQTGKIGNSYLFSGQKPNSNGQGGVEVPDADDLDTFTTATFCAWFYVESPYANQHHIIMSKEYGLDDSAGRSWLVWASNNDWWGGRFGSSGSGQSINVPHAGTSSNDAATWVDAWHQLTVTYEGPEYQEGNSRSMTGKVYLDGTLMNTVNASHDGIPSNALPLMLGTVQRKGTAGIVFDGWLDDLCIWNEVLTGGEVKALYTTVDVSGLEAYNQSYMEKLFIAYNEQGSQTTDDGLTWQYATGLGGTEGAAWAAGGNYYVQIDAFGGGVKAVIPEPSTLLLLTTGLLGLLAYAWRKRK